MPPPPLLLTLSGFFNGMLEVFEPRALNYFAFFRPILLTLSASRNPILTHFPLFRFLDSLLCVLIASTPGLAFSLAMLHTLAVALSFLSGRTYPTWNFLPPLFLHLIPTLIMKESTSLLTTPLRYLFLMCTPLLFSLPQRMAEPISFLPPLFLPPEISSFWGTSISITLSGTQKVLLTPAARKYSTGPFLLTSSPLNDPDTPTLLHHSCGSCSPPDISFAPSSLALSCLWEVLQDLGSDHLPILLSVPLPSAFRPNKHSPSFNFQKACWDGYDSHCPSAEEYSSLFLLLFSFPLWH